MSGYVQLGDVHAYYKEDGDGEPLVLLHPGLADSRAFDEYVPALDRMHREEPTLTQDDLAGYPGPALVMVGDRDEEIRPGTRSPSSRACPTRSSPSSPAPATAASTRASSSTS